MKGLVLALSMAAALSASNDGPSISSSFDGETAEVVGEMIPATDIITPSDEAETPTPIKVETSPCKIMGPFEAKNVDLCAKRDEGRKEFGCTEEQDFVMPVDRRVFDVVTNQWGPWETTGFFGCVDREGTSTAELIQVIEREFASLPITPSVVNIQPVHGHTFVQIPTIVFTSNEPQILTTTLLGTDLEVDVTPTSFTWDFGDGSKPLVTTDPGSPYPNDTLSHTYTHAGEPPITLTTTWTGRFRAAGTNNWQPITGTATTTSTAPPILVQEAQARLVEDALN